MKPITVTASLRTITVTTSFEALHHWSAAGKDIPSCPAYQFLRHPHRHKFGVTVELIVTDHNRELEFFTVQRYLQYVLFPHLGWTALRPVGSTEDLCLLASSCEAMAEALALELQKAAFRVRKVVISEDGENAGSYYPAPVV